MLVLSRKANETIVLGDSIEVTVLEILGERVKIGINAPRDVPIVRQELLHRTQTDHLAAAQPDQPAPATDDRDATTSFTDEPHP